MKCFLRMILPVIFLFTAGMPVFSANSSPVGEQEYVPGEIVFKLTRFQNLLWIAKRYNLHPLPIDRFGRRPIYRMRILDGTPPPELAARMLADPKKRVVYAEPNFLSGFPESSGNSWMIGGSTGEYTAPWYRNVIRLAEAHTVTEGAGVRIAVLDTGAALDHPDLAGHFVDGYDFVDDDADPREVGSQSLNPGYGHGTHVAGLLALVAPQAQIIPVRVLDEDGVGNVWVLAEAIRYAVNPDGDPLTPDGADVINMSLATTRETDLLEEILRDVTSCSHHQHDDDDDHSPDSSDELDKIAASGDGGACEQTKDTVVVAGAGNNSSAFRVYPAGEDMPGLISVAATNKTDSLASFSNFGPWISVAAPGDRILSTVPPAGYATWSGTSMATPLVAGQAALIRAQKPRMKAAKIADRIMKTADPISAPVPRRIDIAASLRGS